MTQPNNMEKHLARISKTFYVEDRAGWALDGIGDGGGWVVVKGACNIDRYVAALRDCPILPGGILKSSTVHSMHKDMILNEVRSMIP
jgi:hypothetical protein